MALVVLCDPLRAGCGRKALIEVRGPVPYNFEDRDPVVAPLVAGSRLPYHGGDQLLGKFGAVENRVPCDMANNSHDSSSYAWEKVHGACARGADDWA